MRSMRACIAGFVFGAVIFVSPPAYAGGGTWFINGRDAGAAIVVVGESVEVEADVWLGENGRGEEGQGFHAGPEHGPFYFYVVRRPDEDWGPFPPPIPEDAIYVADVQFGQPTELSVPARATFTMPDVEPGPYSLLHCNDPCTRQLGDLMSSPFTVVESAAEARLTRSLDELEERVFNQGYWIRRFRIARRNLLFEVAALRDTTSLLQSRVGKLEDRMRALEERDAMSISRAGFVEGGIAAGAVIAILIAFHLLSTRARRR